MTRYYGANPYRPITINCLNKKHSKSILQQKARRKYEFSKFNREYHKKYSEKYRLTLNGKNACLKSNKKAYQKVKEWRNQMKKGYTKHIQNKKFRFLWYRWSKWIKRNGKCQICQSTKHLHAHHLLFRSFYPQLVFNLNNGICLCEKHHKELHHLNGYAL